MDGSRGSGETAVIERIQKFAGQFGWGSVIAGAPYANGVLVATAALLCFFLYVVFSLFGISPAPPSESGNPFSWVLYLLFMAVMGWWYWSAITAHLLFIVGAAWSLADLLGARKSGNEDMARGAVAGLCMAVIPISLWFRQPGYESVWTTPFSIAAHLIHHAF